MVPIRYPQLRFFPQSGKFQPQPIVCGERQLGAPDFPTQEEAALFVAECLRLCGEEVPPTVDTPSLAERPDLAPDERERRAATRKAVAEKARAFLESRRVGPWAPPAPAAEPAQPTQPPRGKKADHPQPAR